MGKGKGSDFSLKSWKSVLLANTTFPKQWEKHFLELTPLYECSWEVYSSMPYGMSAKKMQCKDLI